MHASGTYRNSGSSIGKIAIVGALHLALGSALLGMKLSVPPEPARVIDTYDIPDTPKLKEPDPLPVKQDKVAEPDLPVIDIPVIETDVKPPPLPDQIKTRVIDGQKEDPGKDTGPATGSAGGVNGGTATRSKPVFSAALANAADCVLPDYPKHALRNGDEGTVTLALLIGTNGRVSAHRVQQSSGFRELDRAAIAALSLCQFKPATSDGVAEPAWGQIAYAWRLSN